MHLRADRFSQTRRLGSLHPLCGYTYLCRVAAAAEKGGRLALQANKNLQDCPFVPLHSHVHATVSDGSAHEIEKLFTFSLASPSKYRILIKQASISSSKVLLLASPPPRGPPAC